MAVATGLSVDEAGACGLRRCASSPALRDPETSGLEVYVLCRPFSEFGGPLFHGLPPGAKGALTQMGVCHFVTAFRSADGRLHAFDFGPKGGDISLGFPPVPPNPSASFAWLRPGLWLGGAQGSSVPSAPVPRGTAGEIREEVLTELPPESLYIGRTGLSLSEIRAYNGLQDVGYRLNDNDCRHYVNNLVAYATGTKAASSCLTSHSLTLAKGDAPLGWGDHLLRLATNLTDVRNWPAVQAAGHATLAAAAVLTGHAGLSRVAGSATQQWVARPAGSAAVAAVANVAACLSEAPVVRHTVRFGARLGGSLASVASFVRAGASAGSSTATATRSVLSSAGSATRGVAAVATRAMSGDALRLAGRIALPSAPLGGRLPSFRLPRRRQAQALQQQQPVACEALMNQ